MNLIDIKIVMWIIGILLTIIAWFINKAYEWMKQEWEIYKKKAIESEKKSDQMFFELKAEIGGVKYAYTMTKEEIIPLKDKLTEHHLRLTKLEQQ